jgi:hypothetical protein
MAMAASASAKIENNVMKKKRKIMKKTKSISSMKAKKMKKNVMKKCIEANLKWRKRNENEMAKSK